MNIANYRFDIDTGEIIENDEILFPKLYKIDNKEKADWVLAKILECNSKIQEINNRKKIIIENLNNQIKEHENRLLFFNERFGKQMEEFASEALKGSKKKSLQLDHGKIGFRECRGSTKILDLKKALEWLEQEMLLDAINVTRSIFVSKIPDNVELPVEIFDKTPPYNKFYIEAGDKNE